MRKESGGHRWQRIPPTERRGRVQTSTVTVAVFECTEQINWRLRDSDIRVMTKRDSGPGGQHRNVTDSCVVMHHIPTGIEVKAAAKSQHQNRRTAREMLEARVAAFHANRDAQKLNDARRDMVGSGMRGDKIRTYRERDDLVTDHRSGRRARLSTVRRGQIEDLLA